MDTRAIVLIVVGLIISCIPIFFKNENLVQQPVRKQFLIIVVIPLLGLIIIGLGISIQADTTAFAWLNHQ